MSTGCKQQVMTSRPVKASHKLKTSTGLPPLVSPRMEQIKKSSQTLNFRSISQKMKQGGDMKTISEEHRPATDNVVNVQKTKQIRPMQALKIARDIIIRKVNNQQVKKQSHTEYSEENALKFQSPALVMAKLQFMEYTDGIVQFGDDTMIKEDTILLEKSNRLMTMKNASSNSVSSNIQSSSGSYTMAQGSDQQSSQFDISANPSFTEGKFIGAGQYGQVYTAQDNKTGIIYAVKKINIKTFYEAIDLDSIQMEIDLMKKIKHKNVIRFVHSKQTDSCILIYVEYVSQGNLTQLVEKYGALDSDTVRQYSRQLLDAISYMHDLSIIHRDIKGANILVDSQGIIKVSDFGCSKLKDKNLSQIKTSTEPSLLCSLKGSIPYMAPEVINQETVGFSSDIWSFGCTVLEMATAAKPWQELDFDNPMSALLYIGMEDKIPYVPDNLNPLLKDFILVCLQRDPKLRPTAHQLLQHPFISQ